MLPHEFPRFKMFGRGEVPRFLSTSAGWWTRPRGCRVAGNTSLKAGQKPRAPSPTTSCGAIVRPPTTKSRGGRAGSNSRPLGWLAREPSVTAIRCGLGSSEPAPRPTPPRSPTPGPPRGPSPHRPSTSQPGGTVARPTRRRRPPATRPAQPAAGATNQPWCQRPSVNLREAPDGGVWKVLVSGGLAGTGLVSR